MGGGGGATYKVWRMELSFGDWVPELTSLFRERKGLKVCHLCSYSAFGCPVRLHMKATVRWIIIEDLSCG